MQIYLNGPCGEKFTFNCKSTETLADLKSKLLKKCGDRITDYKITFKGKVLPVENDDKKLGSLGIKENSKIYYTPRMHGAEIYEYCQI